MNEISNFISNINLASKSPARLELLKKQGLYVKAFPTDCDESHDLDKPDEVVTLLAERKLDSYIKSANFEKDTPAIACDTLLWFEKMLIGKAHSEEQAYEQIRMLSGKTHQVYSGYALYYKGKKYSGFDCAEVTFKNISPKALELYIASGEWKGAAGSYHIDGLASRFIALVKGDISTVTGLPLERITDILRTLSCK